MQIDHTLTPRDLVRSIDRVFELAARKVRGLDRSWDAQQGSPVFTVGGRYTTRGWTEWTQGFQYGCMLLVFEGTDDASFFELGRRRTVQHMLSHVTHTGVHDHAFNNLSTFGNLLRLGRGGRIGGDVWQQRYYRAALCCSGAVQAMRWTDIADQATPRGRGFIYSFNGPHSLFIDTMRTIRILCVAHQLGHVLMGEHDSKISLLGRAVQHLLASAQYNVCYGDSSQPYDVRGRTAHEAVFNHRDGHFRCRATQQGYSPFSTWTRGLAWAMLGFSEQLEFISAQEPRAIKEACGLNRSTVLSRCKAAAVATSEHYIHDCSASDGMVYWDDGAPRLDHLGDWRGAPADPYNECEPVDSSASAIAAQGLARLGCTLGGKRGDKYLQAALTIAAVLFAEPYLATHRRHQGLLLHTVYHRPNGWDHVPTGRKIPCDESGMWGDYHLLELAVLIKRLAEGRAYAKFFDV